MMDRECSLKWTLCLLSTLLFALMAVFQAGTVSAQSNRYSGQAFEPLTNTYFHLQYEGGDDWAQGTQQAQFGGTRYVDALSGNGLWLQYGQFGFDHDGHHSLNAGVVRRFWLGGGIVGFGGHYDLTRSVLGNDFQKVAVTGEWFSADNNWTVRGEGNFAVGPDSFLIQDLGTTVDELFFQGNNLMIGQSAGQLREEGMSGLEYELARSLGNYAAEGYLGGYHYLGQIGDDANGIKGGVRGFVSPGVFANLEVREDNVFGTSLYGGVTLFLGGPSRSQPHTLADQMIMPVQRHDQAIVNTVDTRVLLPDVAVTQGGNAITFTHVDNVNTGGGADSGTFEDPFTSLAAASGSTSDIVYVHSGTTYTNDSYQMSNGQRFLGEGGGNQHQLMTDQFGLINLPEVNGIAGARPVIQNGANLITAAGNSEISNFDLLQTNRAIYFDNVNGVVDVNRLMTDAAIEVNGGSGDFTFSDVHIDSSFTDGLRINGGSANVTFSGVHGGSSIAVSDGYTVVVQGNHSGSVLFPTDTSITATDTEGFLFLGNSGSYTFNGTNTIINDGDGGIQLGNAGGTYVFGENTSITNTGDGAVLMNLSGVSNLDLTYSGTIRNFNNESINITGGPAAGQSIVFNSTAEDAIQDNADGISISGTDANVTVSADTELTGSNGLYIGDSDGTYTFGDTDIELSSGTGAAMRISGGSSTVNFREHSSILNTTLDRELLRVENGHTGTLNMEGDVGASAGDGLVFDNADGTYNFTGTTVLNGSTRGIDVGNGSSGTFAFSDTTAIANTTNEAIRMDLANADNLDFTYSGLIRNTTGRAIDISGGPGTGQSVVFNSTEVDAILDGGEGIRIANTDADVNIQADTELTGSNGVEITNSNGTYTFADTDINLSSGANPSLSISGGSSDVNFGANSSITNDQNRSVVNVLDGHIGTLTMDGNISSTAGDGIVFDNADGTYNFNGTTNLDGTSLGINIFNGSAGTFAFSENTSIANTTGTGIRMDLANADNFDFTYSGTLQNSNGLAIEVLGGPGVGQSVLFNSTAADAIQDSGQGIWISNTNADIDILADTELTGSGGLAFINYSGTSTFADTDINLSSGTNSSLYVQNGSGTVNFGADSSIAHDLALATVQVDTGHTGVLNIDGTISSTAGDGLVFDNADGTYNFNGTTALDGTNRGIYVVNGSSGTFAFSEDTSIANTVDSAVELDLTNADNLDFTYSGTIQNSTGMAIGVFGGPGTGQSVLFNSTAADAIQDSGQGIVIADTAADVNIQSDTELTGTSGVTVRNSTGTYTFADTDIAQGSPGNPALWINGGTSTVNFGTDSSVTHDQLHDIVRVENGHTGTLNMDGNVSATAGNGIVFDNADGTYNFNGTTNLNGTARGIDVANGSSGTFAFSENTSITNAGNEAVRIDMANANNLDFTYSGTIQNSSGRAISVSGGPGTGQSVLFNSTATDAIQDSGSGILIAGTDADVNIQSDTELTGSSGLTIAGSDGTYTFADTDIDLSSGAIAPLLIDGGTSDVIFGANSSITNDMDRIALLVQGGHTGTLTMDGTISSTDGAGVQFNNADGTYNFNGTTTLDGTDRGIRVYNGSAGTFAFSEDTSIANTLNEAVQLNMASADNLDFTYSGTIQNSSGRAIDISGGPGTGQTVLFNSTAADAIQDSGEGIRIASTDADVNIQSDTELTGSNGVEITGSTGMYTFADTDINLGSGTSPSLLVNGGSGTINFGANSSITNNSNRRVVDVAGHTGTLNMDGTISSTAGDGIVFNNADGTYNFNGTTNLNGTSNGIQITNGSSGTFTFSADTSITDTTSGTYTESDSTANVTYNGTITQNNNVNAVRITDKTGGTTTFNGLVTANTGSATAVELSDNAGSTTNFNGGLDIDTTTGTGLYASNAGNVNITGAGNSVSTNNGTGIHIADTTVDMIFSDITVLENSSGGDAITLRNMSGDFEVTGTTSIASNGTVGNGINISSGTTAQTGTITFGDVFLGAAGTGGTGRAISVDGSAQTISFGDLTIAGGWNSNDVRYRSIGAAGSLTIDNFDNTASTTVRGLSIQNADGSVTVNGGTIEGASGNGLEVDRGTGTVSIASTIIDTSGGGNVVSISGRGPTSGDINITGRVLGNGGAILVDHNTGGTINFSNEVMMVGDNGLHVDTNTGTSINFTGPDTLFDTTFTAITFVGNDVSTLLNFAGGNLDVTSAFQHGIDATGPGAISITGLNNSIGAFNDDAIDIDGIVFSLNNTWVNNAGAYYTIDTANSTLSGNGNIAPNFNSHNGGGNAGFIEFNGGLDLAP